MKTSILFLFIAFLHFSCISQVVLKDNALLYEKEITEAFSHLDELKEVQIIFRTAKISTSLSARPTLTSLLFRRRSKRTYVVRINCSEKDSIITLNEAPKEAVVGVIGHELSHILDYHQKSCWGVFGRGFAYTSKKKKERFEKEIDSIAISRGFGEGLYRWADFVLNHSDATQEYKAFKRQIYLEPDEIKAQMKSTEKN